MNAQQLAKIGVGSNVRLRDRVGTVTQSAPGWFMITWADDKNPEVVKRRETILTARLELIEVTR